MAEFLREQGASAGAIELLEGQYATAEDDRAFLLWILREALYESHEKTRYKITGGTDLLPRAFASKLQDKIQYGWPVVRIEQDPGKVRVITPQPGRHRSFELDNRVWA